MPGGCRPSNRARGRKNAKDSVSFSPGDRAASRCCHADPRLAPWRARSRFYRRRTCVLVGPAVSILVVPAAVLRVLTATGHRSGASDVRPAATGACADPAVADVLVLLSQREELLSERPGVLVGLGQGPAEARAEGTKKRRC